jgi:hypothetical protein
LSGFAGGRREVWAFRHNKRSKRNCDQLLIGRKTSEVETKTLIYVYVQKYYENSWKRK